MDIKIKYEPFEIERDIKEEKELIIENDWIPTEYEENEYYQEFAEERNQNTSQEMVVYNEVEYLNEIGDSEDDDYADSDDTSMKNDSDDDDGEVETQQGAGNEDFSKSNRSYQGELTTWFADNYISRECPLCDDKLPNYKELRQHIKLNHKDSIEESEYNFYVRDGTLVCKKCNKEFFERSSLFISQFSRYIHSAKHSDEGNKLKAYICKICNFRITKRFCVSKHIFENHPEVVEQFKTLRCIKNFTCPLCFKTFVRSIHLQYHFMDKHPHESKEKLRYHCHLCEQNVFSEEKIFLQHLMEKHELKSWKILNYFKVFEEKEYFACKKCNNIFFRHDSCELLSHFLKHESNFCWACKFCCKKFTFQSSPISHMCRQMVKYYEKQCNEINVKKILKNPGEIKNLQEFEEHFAHVCPFCNKEFDRMLNWQHHLRTEHEIDTLKGLQMKTYVTDSNKLSCIICHTLVANSPEQLHAHRFQHLPYKPYKCLSCLRTLNSFKMSVNHVLNNCKDKGDEILFNLEMQCSLCNYQKIHNLKHYEDKHNNFEEFFFKNSDNTMTCKICNKQYGNHKQNSSFLHLHHHFDEKTFKCKLCLKSFKNLKKISLHLLKAHNVKPLNEQSDEINTDKITGVSNLPLLAKSSIKSHVLNEFTEFICYACPECNESMTTQQMWHTHIMTQHDFFDESNLYIKDSDGSSKCPTCKMAVNSSITQQQKHKLTHMPYRSFICNLCYVRCNCLGVLYNHFRLRHFTQGTFQCYMCLEILQTEHKRTVHLKEKHPRDEWPDTICTICYKFFPSKIRLQRHVVTHDANRLRYTCDICGVKFIKYMDFNAHVDRHKMIDEIEANVDDDFTLQCSSKSIPSTAIATARPKAKDINETKSLRKSVANKRKRN